MDARTTIPKTKHRTMDESRPCMYTWPNGAMLSGRCGAPSLAGTDRCPLHTARDDLPEVYYPPVSLLTTFADGMETSPDTTDDEAATSPESESTLVNEEEDEDFELPPIIPADDIDPDLGADGDFTPAGTGEPCHICSIPMGMYHGPEEPADTTTIVELPFSTPCHHLFGRLCLFTWLAEHNTCPLCRSSLNLSILVPPYDVRSDDNSITFRLAQVLENNHENDDARELGMIYGVDPSRGSFEIDLNLYRVPAGRYVATVLDTVDGRRQLRIDDEAMKMRGLLWDTVDVERPRDSENASRVVTNLADDTQCWKIVEGRTHVRTAGKRSRVPEGAKYVVVTRNGKFVRWAKSYEDWVKGF